jgi:hypothetical protein
LQSEISDLKEGGEEEEVSSDEASSSLFSQD